MKTPIRKTLVCLSLLTLLTSLPLATYSQSVMEEWVARYFPAGFNGSDQATDLVLDASGNIYVTGGSSRMRSGFDYVTIKYNPDGMQQWLSEFNGHDSLTDIANAIAIDDAGNVYVTGRTLVLTGIAHSDYLTIKYDPDGNELWTARYDGPAHQTDMAVDIAVDGQGNVYVTGNCTADSTYIDLATIKYNAAGAEQWVVRYNPPGAEDAKALKVDGAGNVYVTAKTITDSTGFDYVTIKYDTDGNQQWIARYNSPSNANDEPNDLVLDDAGNVYVTGRSIVSTTGEDFLTIKYNSQGDRRWTARFTGLNTLQSERGNALAVDNAGNVYVTGGSYGGTVGGFSDIATVMYDSNGTEQWRARYNFISAGIDEATCIAVDAERNAYVAGYSQSANNYDCITIRYSPTGAEQWAARYNGTLNSLDQISAIALDPFNNVIVTGSSRATGSNEDYTTIKYSQSPTGVGAAAENLTGTPYLYQNFPNPFNPSTRIRYAIPAAAHGTTIDVTLRVFDLLGNQIAERVDRRGEAGIFDIDFRMPDHAASGVYFYQVTTGDFLATGRMLFLK